MLGAVWTAVGSEKLRCATEKDAAPPSRRVDYCAARFPFRVLAVVSV